MELKLCTWNVARIEHVKVTVSVLVILSLFAACTTTKHHKLTYRNTFELKDNTLRTDGYFVCQDSPRNLLTAFIFYANGTVAGLPDTYYEQEKQFIDEVRLHQKSNDELFFGAYRIDHDTIKIQSFYLSGENNFASIWEVREDRGVIKNDTTILLLDWVVKGKTYRQQKTYNFRGYRDVPTR